VLRTIGIGIIAAVSLVGVLGIVFAVGALRIRLADDNTPPPAPVPPATMPAAPESGSPPAIVSDPAKDAIPVLSIDSIGLPAEKATLSPGLSLDKDTPRPVPTKRHKGQIGPGDAPPPVRQAITGFRTEDESAEWSANITKPGQYEIDLVYACVSWTKTGVDYVVKVGDQELKGETAGTRGGRENYQVVTVGSLKLPAGTTKIQFRLAADRTHAVMLRLREVRLIPEL
jgi:hypothetical protein